MMKKSIPIRVLAIFLAIAMCLFCVTGCQEKEKSKTEKKKPISVSEKITDEDDPEDSELVESNPEESDGNDYTGNTYDTGDISECDEPPSEAGKTVTTTENVKFDGRTNPLSRGINLSSLEFDVEVGYDNWLFQGRIYDTIREKGFDHVRLPVDFFLYMGDAPDYKIDEEFLHKIDTIINIALRAGLKIVLDFHHFGELQTDCKGNKQKYYAMWEQLATHYCRYPSGLVFELLNEPGNLEAIQNGGPDVFTPAKIMEIQEQAIKIIRKTNPTRLIVHATCWNNGAAQLMDTEPLLPDDKNLIMSVHSYEPMEFTHQNADWNNDGIFYPTTDFTDDMKYPIELVFKMVEKYQNTYGRPVWIGEFGAVGSKAPAGARAKYAEFLVDTMKKTGCGWCWWEFRYGLYSVTKEEWMDEALIDALMK